MELRALLVPAPAPPNRNQLTSVSFIRSLSIPQARSLTFRRHPIAAKARCATGAPLEGAPVCFRCPPPKAPKARNVSARGDALRYASPLPLGFQISRRWRGSSFVPESILAKGVCDEI